MRGRHIAVVGASAAGLAAVETLRREGFDGRLTVIGDEALAPYDRPPLSKQVLDGTWQPDAVHLRTPDQFGKLGAEWRLGVAATSADTVARTVTLADGSEIPYDGLVIATGVAPRLLPFGHHLVGVHVLRGLGDAIALRAGLLRASSVVVVGGGFLGAEVAAVARSMGCDVTIAEPLPTLMARQLGGKIGDVVAGLHAARGVQVITGTAVADIVGDNAVRGVRLSDGRLLPSDLVLVAVGSVPNTGWLEGSGLTPGDGVQCDESLLAAPGVVAAGDVASWWHAGVGRRMRLEHRMNATEQGMAAARTLMGKPAPFLPVPYFWSDQYGEKIQVYGAPGPEADVEFTAGAPGDGKFAAVYREHGQLVAGLAWNMPKQALAFRAQLQEIAGYAVGLK